VLEVRRARGDELAALGDLIVDAYVADDLVGDGSYVEQLRAVERRAAEAEVLVAVDPAEPTGQLLGTVTYCPHGSPWAEVSRANEAEFRMLAVSPAARGRGVAVTLVEACDARAAAEGRRTLALSVIRHNERAQRLYERLGFVRAPERDWEPLPGVELLVWTRGVRPGAAAGTGAAATPPAPADAARP
jgi:GNAT superfamily N-acetyltransferase